MLYLIDGYNLLFRLKGKKQGLKQAREFLIHALGTLVSSFSLKALIVFDSSLDQAMLFPSKSEKPPLEVVFAPYGLTADDYILELLEYKAKKTPITLVTSDAGLAHQAKPYRIKTMTIEQLFDFFGSKYEQKSLKEETNKDQITAAFEGSINFFLEEFEKRLKEDKKD
jgi:predicted RNA-binding protein with PIN domain